MPTASKTFIGTIALLVLLPLLAACGYRPLSKMYELPGLDGVEPLAVYMPMWANATNEFGLETEVYNKVADWLQGSEYILLKKKESQAEYVLTGTIGSLDLTSSRGTARLTVRYSLKNQTTGDMVWPETSNSFSKSYLITDDAFTTNSERKKALDEIADDLGEKIYVRFLNTMTELRKKHAEAQTNSLAEAKQEKTGSE